MPPRGTTDDEKPSPPRERAAGVREPHRRSDLGRGIFERAVLATCTPPVHNAEATDRNNGRGPHCIGRFPGRARTLRELRSGMCVPEGGGVAFSGDPARDAGYRQLGTRTHAVAFSPDGGQLASAGDDGAIRLWNVASSQLQAVVHGHAGAVRSLAFSRDGRMLASGGDDATVRVWDLSSYHPRTQNVLTGHRSGVRAVAFCADLPASPLASASADGEIRFWDPARGSLIVASRGQTDPDAPVALGPDGTLLSVTGDGLLLHGPPAQPGISLDDPRTDLRIPKLERRVGAVAFSPDGSLIASGGDDLDAVVRSAADGAVVARLANELDFGTVIAISPSNNLLASGSAHGGIFLWLIKRSSVLAAMPRAHTGRVNAVTFSPEDTLLASAGDDGIVRLWDTLAGRPRATLDWRPGATASDYHLLRPPATGTQDRAPLPTAQQPRYLDDDVQFTVYRPRVVRPLEWNRLLAFAHLAERRDDANPDAPDPLEEVQNRVHQALGPAASGYQRVVQDARQAVPREGELTFLPEIAGVEFYPPARSFLWLDAVHQEEFRFRADPGTDGRTLRGSMTVLLGTIILADLTLTIRVDSGHLAVSRQENQQVDRARPYRKIFASYSRQDLPIVEQIERYAPVIGDAYLRDLRYIRTGEPWSPRLREMIFEADVFQLFWSTNSMQSPNVRAEWEYALSLRRHHFIRPIYWEDPFPESRDRGLPPEALRSLHFHCIRHVLVPAADVPQAAPDYGEAPTLDPGVLDWVPADSGPAPMGRPPTPDSRREDRATANIRSELEYVLVLVALAEQLMASSEMGALREARHWLDVADYEALSAAIEADDHDLYGAGSGSQTHGTPLPHPDRRRRQSHRGPRTTRHPAHLRRCRPRRPSGPSVGRHAGSAPATRFVRSRVRCSAS